MFADYRGSRRWGVEERRQQLIGVALELVIRSWISLVESTALIWLDGRRVPRGELETQLVHDFAALAAVSAAYDDELAGLLRRVVKDEPADGPFHGLATRLMALAS